MALEDSLKRMSESKKTTKINPILKGYAYNLGLGKEVLKGAAKGLASTALNIGKGITGGSPALALSELAGTVKPGTQRQTIADVESLKKRVATPSNTAQEVGFAAEQVGEMFIPIGAEAKIASSVPGLAGRALGAGAEYGAKTLIQTGGDIEKAAKSAALSAAFPIASEAVKALGKGLYKLAIPLSSKEAQMVQVYKAENPLSKRVAVAIAGKNTSAPRVAEETAFENALKGTESGLGVKATRAYKNLWTNIVEPSLKKSKATQNMDDFWASIEKEVVKQNPEISRQKDLLEALSALKKDYKGVKSVSMLDLQQFKEGWAKFLPEKVYKGKSISGAFNEVKNIASSTARNIIYNKMGPDIQKAYFDYGNLKGLAEAGQKAMTGAKLKGGAGTFLSAVKDMLVYPVATYGGRVLYRTGQGLEFLGKPGAKTVIDIFSNGD